MRAGRTDRRTGCDFGRVTRETGHPRNVDVDALSRVDGKRADEPRARTKATIAARLSLVTLLLLMKLSMIVADGRVLSAEKIDVVCDVFFKVAIKKRRIWTENICAGRRQRLRGRSVRCQHLENRRQYLSIAKLGLFFVAGRKNEGRSCSEDSQSAKWRRLRQPSQMNGSDATTAGQV